MEEKVLVKSERYNVERGLRIVFLIIAGLCLLSYGGIYINELVFAKEWWESGCSYVGHHSHCVHAFSSPAVAAWNYKLDEFWIFTGAFVVGGIICLLIYLWMRSYEMTVTDKRVYGKTAFGKRVDLPMDSVSAIGSRWPKGITVATSSGSIAFLLIKNSTEIHTVIGQLLLDRQNARANSFEPVIKQEIPQSSAEELKKFRELLDSGIITQEEFDAKKKQLLGL